jgi:WD40 repeat protein
MSYTFAMRWRVNFSLRTFIIALLLACSGGGLYYRWAPWYLAWTVEAHRAEVSPDGSRAVTIDAASVMRLWNTASGQCLAERTVGPSGWFQAVFSHNNFRLATRDGDGRVSIWDADAAELLAELDGRFDVSSDPPVFTPNDRTLVCKLNNGPFAIYDAISGKQRSVLKDTNHFLYCVTNSIGTRILCSHARYTYPPEPPTDVWDVETGDKVCTFVADLNHIVLSPDGHRACTYGLESRETAHSMFWNLDNGQKMAEICQVYQHWKGMYAFAGQFSTDGKLLVTSYGNPDETNFFDVVAGKALPGIQTTQKSWQYFWFSPDSCQLLVDVDGRLRLFDVASRRPLGTLPRSNADLSRDISPFSPDGRMIVTSVGKNFAIWDAATCECLFEARKYGSSIRFTEDGDRLVIWDFFTKDPDNHISIWRRRRPEWWWGVAWLPEFWLCAAFSGALIWSLYRDWRDRRHRRRNAA